MPAPPAEPEPSSFPWVQLVAPLVLAAGAYFGTTPHQARYLLFALMSPASSRSFAAPGISRS